MPEKLEKKDRIAFIEAYADLCSKHGCVIFPTIWETSVIVEATEDDILYEKECLLGDVDDLRYYEDIED